MRYISTRSNHEPVSASTAIQLGMVPGGGLFIPEFFPVYDIESFSGSMYSELAADILSLYLTDFSREEIANYVGQAYGGQRFDHPAVAPLHHLENGISVLELWHGPTAAFKDMALQLMPHILTASVHKNGSEKETVMLVATSGDTGKAALEGFKDVPGTRIIVFYPKGGVSRVQELQMLSTTGKNTSVVSVEGNFDDCQTMVKEIFSDIEYGKRLNAAGYAFSSANSINWGRLVPQIVYYFWAYKQMRDSAKIAAGEAINFVVPTGNFGNILAGWYAKQMGLPVKRFICATNKNRVLADFFATGEYDRRRDFYKTSSPSMDILISSNLERFLYHMSGNKGENIGTWYEELVAKGVFAVDGETMKSMTKIISADTVDEIATAEEIGRVYKTQNYLMDTHTAVGSRVANVYKQVTKDETPIVLDSTASPFKFGKTVYAAAFGKLASERDEIEIVKAISEKTGLKLHRTVDGLERLPLLHNRSIIISEARAVILEILGIG